MKKRMDCSKDRGGKDRAKAIFAKAALHSCLAKAALRSCLAKAALHSCFVLLVVVFGMLWLPGGVEAQESLCAEVKLEIVQELTLERQAFEAHMRINNGLPNITLEDVQVTVNFTDEDDNPVTATSNPNVQPDLSDPAAPRFFIRLDDMQNVNNAQIEPNDLDFTGSVAPSTSADIYWLIIPVPGSSEGTPQGKLYYVGATLTYMLGGEEQVTEVTPDYIYVKPMPELYLDYFLPYEVYGDDAFTIETEPPVPFSLGVRVSNQGFGTAWKLKIDSAQPKIVENEQGLLVDFLITGSEVNGEDATSSLLVDFGDIDPQTAGLARWMMEVSLSGSFDEFTAEFTHADEFGGELTSLIEEVNTHYLIRDVLVDVPGRDDIRDFLATDDPTADTVVYRLYESENTDAEVTDQSASSTLVPQDGSTTRYTLSNPPTAGFMFVNMPISEALGSAGDVSAVRSDSKTIQPDNVWISKTRKADPQDGWDYFVNLFDVNTTETYTLVFEGADAQPPALEFIPDQARAEGQPLSFLVQASDPDGTIPGLSVTPFPAGATFTDHGDGTGTFDWTPAVGQAGTYYVMVEASDDELSVSQQVTITITTESSYTMTASAGSGGTITPTGAIAVNTGMDQTFTITPDTGYHIVDVLVDGTSAGAVSTYTFTTVIADHTIAATFAINTYTITATAGSNGSITPSGAVTVEHGSDQAFTITPDEGYHIIDVLVDGESVEYEGLQDEHNFVIGGTVTFLAVDADHTLEAVFAVKTYPILATAGTGGSISPAGETQVDHGAQQTLTITPESGYQIEDVLVDGTSMGVVSSYTFTNVSGPHTIQASFVPDTHTITATAGANGTITPSGAVTVEHDAEQGFTITADAGYSLDDVVVDGVSVGALSTYTFSNVTADHTIEATFAINTYTITATAGANGSITPSGAVTVEHGAEQIFSITPDTGYHIIDVLVDGESVEYEGLQDEHNFVIGGTVTFLAVDADHTLEAVFAVKTYTILATAGTGGSISPAGETQVDHGAQQTLTITPESGYQIEDVLVDGTSVGAVSTYTFMNVSGPHTIQAVFTLTTTEEDPLGAEGIAIPEPSSLLLFGIGLLGLLGVIAYRKMFRRDKQH